MMSTPAEFRKDLGERPWNLSEPDPVVDYTALQAALAERVCSAPGCEDCEFTPYGAGPSEGYEACTHRAAWVRKCESCKVRQPFKWIADIDPNVFERHMRAEAARRGVVDLEDLKALLT